MNLSNYKGELILGVVVVFLVALLLNPTDIVMLDATTMMLLALFVAAVLGFTALVWREHAGDEREATHRVAAGRVSYLVGASILTIGIIVQGFNHQIDPWLLVALGAAVVVKLTALVYFGARH